MTEIETSPEGIKVITSDGSNFEGDIVVGADGVNSTVKRCMWKAMEIKSPELVAKESKGNPYFVYMSNGSFNYF